MPQVPLPRSTDIVPPRTAAVLARILTAITLVALSGVTLAEAVRAATGKPTDAPNNPVVPPLFVPTMSRLPTVPRQDPAPVVSWREEDCQVSPQALELPPLRLAPPPSVAAPTVFPPFTRPPFPAPGADPKPEPFDPIVIPRRAAVDVESRRDPKPDPFDPIVIPVVEVAIPETLDRNVQLPLVPSASAPADARDARVTLEQVTGIFPQQAGNPGACSACGGESGGCNRCAATANGGFLARLLAATSDALLCPDPCYKPAWTPLADTAFYTESARPVTHTRLRWEYGRYARFADRGEFFWARADGNGKGPKPEGAIGIPRVDYHELQQYTETATGAKFSAFVSTPYRSMNPIFADPPSSAGFGDITIGTKSVLFDSELALLTLQFKTILPVGNPAKGLGTGHVSLEPSLLFGLRVSPNSYLQGQVAEWIPLGGDPTYSGAVLHYHLAYNHVLWRPATTVQLIGTFELNGYSWQDGGFTDPAGGFRKASGTNILQLGPGVRLFFGDRYDFGVGSNFGVTGSNSIEDQFRFEMRIRY